MCTKFFRKIKNPESRKKGEKGYGKYNYRMERLPASDSLPTRSVVVETKRRFDLSGGGFNFPALDGTFEVPETYFPADFRFLARLALDTTTMERYGSYGQYDRQNLEYVN